MLKLAQNKETLSDNNLIDSDRDTNLPQTLIKLKILDLTLKLITSGNVNVKNNQIS